MDHRFISDLGDTIPVDIENIGKRLREYAWAHAREEDDPWVLEKIEYVEEMINLYPSIVTFMDVHGNTPVHLAAQNGNISILRKLLESREAAYACKKINKQGETAFMLACLNNHVDAATILVEETNSMTMVELYAAFSGQHPVIVDKILEKFPRLVFDVDKEQSTLLHKACVEKNLEMARTLLDVDQSIAEMVNKDGLMPLHCAVMTGSVEILKEFLYKAPLTFNIKTQRTNETVFHLAARQKNTKAFIFMAQNAGIEELLYNLDINDNTVLHFAAHVNSTSLVRYILLETTIDATLKNKKGFAAGDILNKDGVVVPLLSTWFQRESETVDGGDLEWSPSCGEPDRIGYLKNKPTIIDEVHKNRYDATILHEVVRDGHEKYAAKIINLCPSLISFRNDQGNTPLHLAAQNGNTNILMKMLESGEAVCTKINKKGETAFMLACLNNHVDAATILVEETNSMTIMELYAAFSGQHTVIVDKILEKFPHLVFDVDKEQSTLLHKACMEKNLEMTKMLLDVDQSQSIAEMANKDGLTPLHYAAMTGSVEILKEFLYKAPSSFSLTTQGTNETVFHLAAKQKNTKAFIFMAQSATIGEIIYNLDAEDNTVLHLAASLDSTSLVRYILKHTTIDATLKNKKGFAAADLLNKDGVDFRLLSTWFRQEAETIQRPAGLRYVKFAHEPVEHIPNTNNGKMLISESCKRDFLREVRVPRNKEREMHSESLQNARNTITIVAVLIASVAFTCGINPPGGIHQDGIYIGKATAGRTVAFKIFFVTNNIALFISLSIVTLLVSIIPYRTKSLKKFVTIAHKMMWLAVASMAIAYAAAAWITVPDFDGSIWLVYTTAVIATVALGGMFVYVTFMMVKHIFKKDKLRRNMSRGKAPSTTLDLEAAADTGCYGF